MNHTPAPWKVTKDPVGNGGEHYFRIESGPGYFRSENISNFFGGLGEIGGFEITAFMQEGDAHLISAAPDLLVAARKTFSVLRDLEDEVGKPLKKQIHSVKNKLRVAINKAEGLS